MDEKNRGPFLGGSLIFLPSGNLLAFAIFDGIINLI